MKALPNSRQSATKGNAPTTKNGRGAEITKNSDTMNFDTINGWAQQSPALAMLTAGLASAGYSLHELADGSYLACRWGYSRALCDLYAVRRFLAQVGGKQ